MPLSTPSTEPVPPNGRRSLSGRGWIALAAVLWSLSGFFAKAPVFQEWPADVRGPLLAFWRALFAGMLILPAVRRPRWTPRLVPMALSFGAMNVTYLTAMTLTTAANAIWLQSTAPWWVFLFAVLILKEPITRGDLITLPFAVAGVGFILWHEIQSQAPAGTAWGLAAGVAYAAVVVQIRSLRDENSAWLVVVNHLVTAAVILPYVIYRGIWPTMSQLPLLAAFGMLQMGLPYLCFALGLRSVSSQEATALGLLEPLLLPIWVFLAWGEEPAWWTMVGASLIFAGLVLRYGAGLRGRQDGPE